jgi:hypothetical protein
MVVHALVAPTRRASRPTSEEKAEETTTLTLQSKANNFNNHFNFLLELKTQIDGRL